MSARAGDWLPRARPIPSGRSQTVAVLDIGSTKICCLIARLRPQRQAVEHTGRTHAIEVVGVGHQRAVGVKRGAIVDMESAERSVRLAVDAAERMAGVTVESVIVNVSAGRIASEHFSASVDVIGESVTDGDIGRVLEQAVASGRIRPEDLFDRNYVPIPNTRPQKYTTKFDALTDELFPPIQEPILDANKEVVYAGAVDVNGYFPTHNKRYAQPLTGDEKKDLVGNRTKRIFDDPVGKRCVSHEQPFLLQTYRRDTGEIMHDLSVPIYVQGRRWGAFRLGYRTE